jgi:sulfur carrier protein
MEITLNGEKKTIEKAGTLADVMTDLGIAEDAKGVAAAVNDAVVPRSQWRATPVHEGDRIEVVRAVQGG